MRRFHILPLATLFLAGAAGAHGDVRCDDHPQTEWRKQTELQKELTAQGWKVRQVKTYNNCYEVYGFDAKGERAEVFFDPVTFERVISPDER